MNKPLIAVLCAGLLLSGCSAQETVNTVEIDAADYPMISVSPTLEPLAQRVTQAALGCSGQDALKHILRADSSGQAYHQFAQENAAQMLIAYETDLGDDIEWIPFGTDALVFTVSSDCTVNNLSVQQIKDIYAGRITDWSEVGGTQQPIRIHHRAKGSASRSALEHAMKVRAAESTSKARTGSLYYMTYSEYQSAAKGSLKLLAVDGVLPA
ncbi:MAG: substrate-binding domain-containing protein, partial [Butyricicoccaceae bacterium]